MSRVRGLLLVFLVSIGCLRPVLPDVLRAHWVEIVVVLSLGATGLGLWQARRGRSRHEAVLLSLLPVALAATYLQPQRVASDGIFYFAPLHSVVVDGDLDFENEYRVLGAEPGYFQRTETGRLPNNYSIGPALFWAPFYLLAHALGLVGAYRPTGFGYPYFTAVATGTVVAGFAGVWAMFRLVRHYFPPDIALIAVLFCWLGTFHAWYMTFEPSMSHAIALASVTLYFLATHRGVTGVRGYVIMGALGGVVALVRWQNVLLLPVALGVSYFQHGRPTWRPLLAGASVFGVVFLPQLIYWRLLYGSFLLVPQGGDYIEWTSPAVEAVLFSSRHGLLSWAPILYLGILGLPGFVRRAPAFGWGLVISSLFVLWVNASVFDWWAGASFGSRRFDGTIPAFALGLAVVLHWLAARVAAHPVRAIGIALLPFLVWNGMLMGVYFTGAVPADGPASFRQAAADGVDLLYRRTGYPFSWPASLRHRWLDGHPLVSYDVLGAGSVANNVDIRMGDTDALFLGAGWSLPIRARETTWREVSARGGEVFLALREPAPYVLEISGDPGGRASIVWNGAPLGEVSLESDPVGIAVPAHRVREGPNRLQLVPPRGVRLRISRLRLTRPGEF